MKVYKTVLLFSLHCCSSDDVAVIDEIQMLKDPERGGAWTRALLGMSVYVSHPL